MKLCSLNQARGAGDPGVRPLAGFVREALFPNQDDFDRPLVRKLFLDGTPEAAEEFGRPEVIDHAGVDDDPQFATRLERIGLPDTLKAEGEGFQVLYPLDVTFQRRGTRPWP